MSSSSRSRTRTRTPSLSPSDSDTSSDTSGSTYYVLPSPGQKVQIIVSVLSPDLPSLVQGLLRRPISFFSASIQSHDLPHVFHSAYHAHGDY